MSSGAITRIHDCPSPLPSNPMPSEMSSTGHRVMKVHHTVHEMIPSVLPSNTKPMKTVPSTVQDALGTPLCRCCRA